MSRFGLVIVGVLCLLCSAHAEPLRLTLADAVKMAVEHNLPLRVERYNPVQYEAEIIKNRGIYNPSLKVDTSFTRNTDPAAGMTTKTTQLNASLVQLLPSGATVSLGFDNTYLSSGQTSVVAGHSSYWQSGLGLTLSQPLLRNFGREATELSIDSARLSKEASIEALKTTLISLVAQVRTEYFKLYSLREELLVRQASLELARRVLHDTQARVISGVLPAMENLNAEYGVAGREKELIDAELSVHNQMELLTQLLQASPAQAIEVSDKPSRERYPVSEIAEVQRAYQGRPELRELQHAIEQQELQTRVAARKKLPDLTATATVGTGGLAANYPRDVDRMVSGNYPVWGVGLTFSYPFGNHTAEFEYRKNKIKLEQLTLQLQNQKELIANEVRAAVRAIEANFKQLEVADRGRSFAEERLRAWVRKSEVGLATTKDVLDVENDLATAKSNQIKAAVAYAAAITQLWKSTGQMIEKEGLVLRDPGVDPALGGVR